MTTNKKTNASYITDFGIRIYAPKVNKNYWRISYVDQEGKLRDTTATSERLAMDRASEIEKLLMNNVGNLPHNTVAEMIDEFIKEKTKIHIPISTNTQLPTPLHTPTPLPVTTPVPTNKIRCS